MKRIETSTKASDLFGPGKHGFTDGDPVNGVLATRLNAEFFNQVQEEIASVIEGYGGELDGSNRQQLLQAIQSAIAAIPPIPEARTHQAGLVELATQTETETGTSETRAVTPKALKKRLDDLSRELAQIYATVSKPGLVELATQSEVNTGTSDSRVVTPKTLAAYTTPYDIPFNAGFDGDHAAEDLEERTYASLIIARDVNVDEVVASLETSSSSASVRFDLEENGTSIFTTKPSFSSSSTRFSSGSLRSSTRLTKGSTLTFKVTDIGSSRAGAGLRVAVRGRAS